MKSILSFKEFSLFGIGSIARWMGLISMGIGVVIEILERLFGFYFTSSSKLGTLPPSLSETKYIVAGFPFFPMMGTIFILFGACIFVAGVYGPNQNRFR